MMAMATQMPTSEGDSPGVGSVDWPPIVGRRHPLRWLSAVVLVLLAAMLVHALVTNAKFGWHVVATYLFNAQILEGLERTLLLTAAAMAIGVILGTLLAVFRMSRNPVLSVASYLYIWFFRGTPLLVQLIFWYNLAALYAKLSLGIPFGPALVSASTNQVFSVWVAAIVAFGLNEAAYTAEIIRGGLLAVDPGQTEAARALGMSEVLVFRRIILPQALRVIVPPIGNQVIGMLKYTSLVSVIALPDLLYSSELIYQNNYQTIPLLIVACLWYLAATTVLTIAQVYVERHYGKGFSVANGNETRWSLDRFWSGVLSRAKSGQ